MAASTSTQTQPSSPAKRPHGNRQFWEKPRKANMEANTTILDANTVLRFLIGDIEEQAVITKQTYPAIINTSFTGERGSKEQP
jgi:hypothetical protein